MKKVKLLAVLNFIFFVIAFAVSNLSQLKIFGGVTNATISNKYDTVFTPAGVTFAIWGVIYLSLFGFTIYHLIKAYQDDLNAEASVAILKIGNLFIINNIATTFWVFAFTYEYLLLSMLLIIIQLITLLMIFIKLNLWDTQQSFKNKLFTQFPLSIYFAWLCVATVANISLYLVSVGVTNLFGVTEVQWATALICVVTLITLFIIGKKKNFYFGLVVIWALYGIQMKRTAIDPVEFASLIKLCWMGIGILAITSALELFKITKSNKKEQVS